MGSDRHTHTPAVILQTGEKDEELAYDNYCSECGRRITREKWESVWVTDEEALAYALEMRIEDELEWDRAMEEALHPEWRTPPRE